MSTYKTIGILGGMGAEATVDLYMGIWKYFQEKYNARYDKDFPPVIIYSVPIPDVVESLENEKVTLEMLQKTSKTLESSGCDFIVIACNTVQYLLDRIRKVVKIPITGIAETNAEYLNGKGIKQVGILATKTTIDKKVYDKELNKIGIQLIKPNDENQTIVTEVIMTQLAGKAGKVEKQKLLKVINKLRKQGAEAILLACTDLPPVISQKDTSITLVNCTENYANKTAELSRKQ